MSMYMPIVPWKKYIRTAITRFLFAARKAGGKISNPTAIVVEGPKCYSYRPVVG